MSFPMRFWFYDRNENELIDPEESASDMIIIDPRGERSEGKKAGRLTKDINCYILRGKYIPLASTGLEDSEGREIIEGHVLRSNGVNVVVEWYFGGFVAFGKNKGRPMEFLIENGNPSIVGHAITDPEMIPDGFDPEEYWGFDTDE